MYCVKMVRCSAGVHGGVSSENSLVMERYLKLWIPKVPKKKKRVHSGEHVPHPKANNFWSTATAHYAVLNGFVITCSHTIRPNLRSEPLVHK